MSGRPKSRELLKLETPKPLSSPTFPRSLSMDRSISMGDPTARRSDGGRNPLDNIIRDYGEPPPELVIVDQIPEIANHSVPELRAKIERMRSQVEGSVGVLSKLPDKGEKLRTRLRRFEEELERRTREKNDAVEGEGKAMDLDEPKIHPGVSHGASSHSKFFSCFCQKLKTEKSHTPAFWDQLRTFHNHNRLEQSKPSMIRSTNSFSQLSSSSRSNPVVNGRQRSVPEYYKNNVMPQIPPPNPDPGIKGSKKFPNRLSRQLTSKKYDNVVILDEEDAIIGDRIEDDVGLVEMSNVKIYYPTRDHADCVEICYQDIKCLDPDTYLSSTIMNFYIQYLQKPFLPTGRPKGEYYFFNTYFYSKLAESLTSKLDNNQKLSKLRRWFKGINLFQKAYIFLPVHGSLHWSLVIICIPVRDGESGPILLHLDSLGFHDTKVTLENIKRYLKAEWEYMIRTCGPYPPDLPISEDTWRDLPNRFIKKRIMVPQQTNEYDCGLFVLYFMERFLMEAPERVRKEDLDMFGHRWFHANEASGLRKRLRELLMEEFENARLIEDDKEY